jgi:RNA polymerase sigma-70 factor (ECF subfamily)
VILIPTGRDESELVRNILSGRRELFEDLIAPHLTPLLRTIKATIRSSADVEDIVQQTVLKAFTHLDQFRFEASFRTWLIRIGLNETRAWLRKSGSSRFLTLNPVTLTQLPFSDESHSPWVKYQRSEVSVRLCAALAQLSEKYRIVILRRDLYGFSLSEVAAQLGLTIAAVKTRQLRARQQMAKFLGPLVQSPPRRRACR